MGDGDRNEATYGESSGPPEPGVADGDETRPTMRAMLAAHAVAPARAAFETPRELVVPAAPAGAHATLTVIAGLDAGRVFSIDQDEVVIGRAPTCHVWVDDPSVSRQHARILHRAGEPFTVEDLHSTNGTFLGERRVDYAPLASGDRLQIGPKALFRFAIVDGREEALQRDLFQAATRDPLCGAYNRRYFDERLLAEVSRARRNGRALALLMLDLDGFKAINDRHGHPIGDEVLRTVCHHLGRLVRLEDVLARYGGEEFVLLAPGIEHDEASHLGERLRAAIERLTIHADQLPRAVSVTVSVGVAALSELPIEAGPGELIARADARLYRAKRDGRNRVATTG